LLVVEASRDAQEAAADREAHLGKVARSGRSDPFAGVGENVQQKLNQAAEGLVQSADAQAQLTNEVAGHLSDYQAQVKEIAGSVRKVMQAEKELGNAYRQDIRANEGDRVKPLDLDGMSMAQIVQDQGNDLNLDRMDFHAGNSSDSESADQESSDLSPTVVGGHTDQIHDFPSRDRDRDRDRDDSLDIASGVETPSSVVSRPDTGPILDEEQVTDHGTDQVTPLTDDQLMERFDEKVNEKFDRTDEDESGRPPPPLDFSSPGVRDQIAEVVLDWNRDFPDNEDIVDKWKKKHDYPDEDDFTHQLSEPVVGAVVTDIGQGDDTERTSESDADRGEHGQILPPGGGLIHDDMDSSKVGMDSGELSHDVDTDVHHSQFAHKDHDAALVTSHEYNDLDDWESGWSDEEDHLAQLKNGHKANAKQQVGDLLDSSLVQMEDKAEEPPAAYDDADYSDQEPAPRHNRGRRTWHRQRSPGEMPMGFSEKRHRNPWYDAIDAGVQRQRSRQLSLHRPQDRKARVLNDNSERLAYQGLSRQNHRRHRASMELRPRSFGYERGYRPMSEREHRSRSFAPSEWQQRHNPHRFD
jgi:hypothetical protein